MSVLGAIVAVSTGQNQMAVRRSAVDIGPFVQGRASTSATGSGHHGREVRVAWQSQSDAVIGQTKTPQSEGYNH